MQEKVWRYQRGNSKDRQYNTNEKEQNDQQ